MARKIGTPAGNFIIGSKDTDLISGQGGNDRILGGGGRDWLYGDAGNDKLYGGDGNDYLDGGAGNDVLVGGRGCDMMKGGAGNDRYVFSDLGFSNKKDAFGQRLSDVVIGFKSGEDKLDFTPFDLDTNKAGRQGFRFVPHPRGGDWIGNSFTGAGRELIHTVAPGRVATYIEGDVDGDRKADFRIAIYSNQRLRTSDFIL